MYMLHIALASIIYVHSIAQNIKIKSAIKDVSEYCSHFQYSNVTVSTANWRVFLCVCAHAGPENCVCLSLPAQQSS